MVSSADKKKVALSIDGEKKVPAIDFINSIQHIQTILYNVGDYLYGNPFRTSGDFPQAVKDSCTLLFTDLKLGSVDAELEVGNGQVGITNQGTLGEMAVCTTRNLMEAISRFDISKEELHNIISDPHRLNRLLKEFYLMSPETVSPRTVSIGFCGEPMIPLSPNHRSTLKELMHKPSEEHEKEVFGWVFDLRVDQQKKIMIDTPEGQINCSYNSLIEAEVVEHIGKFVNIKGTTRLHNRNYIMYIDTEDSIEKSSQYFIKEMSIETHRKNIEWPITLEFEKEDDLYIASNDELGILATGKKMSDVIQDAKEQLFILFKEYVLYEGKLSESGHSLSKKLKGIVGDCRGFL
ncbi:hypothetical protein [Methanolobus psychrotolerans]|uniref:hypothetical protein n=1 Tax=Methanolobus psychrotolerans TaxID=1874706 RepID=UPI000B91B943|nr:hypothetical protein [Methanolobus psychrotolerans]